eukprot:TRINITY_DN41464_c0_g2_i1.p3 TRINITY_DN41464_c0_g2~~TRINITY_DN41464_c0_g2_i1.p3  ORF type:complete len:119 (+),score=34.90 TRINITY_DN41464_c0_g2_i1:126-482(+)
MEVFMLQRDIEPLLTELGFHEVKVDESNSRMDVWELAAEDMTSLAAHMLDASGVSHSFEGCSHARKAAERLAEARLNQFLESDREAGIHWGNPQFDHIQDFDMNELCARVVISARKRG